jgi:hypothetical protein
MMQQDEYQQANFEGEQTNSGGAAPEQRCCQYIKADGKACRDWSVRGQKLCYRHGVFVHSGRGIDVPLLEDESSIVLVLSETLRAVALGTVSVNTGRLLMDGCRLAHTMQIERQKAVNLERSYKRKCAREDEMNEESQDAEAVNPAPNRDCGPLCPEPNQQCGAPSSELSSEPSEETLTTPVLQPSSSWHLRFRDRRENSDEHLAEVATEALFDPRYEEARGEVLAAVAAPLDEEMEEETLAVGVS